MSHADLKSAIDVAWKSNLPLTEERALELALDVLATHPRERKGFSDWFLTHGPEAVRRANG